jgi:hypothetical protein
MTEPEDFDDQIRRLRDATAAVAPSAAFGDGVLAAASTLHPRSRDVLPRRAWLCLPFAAAMAAASLLWAASVRERRVDAETARDIALALGAQEQSSW